MSVRKSLAWTFSGQIAASVISFLGTVVLARLLTPREVGVYAVAMATAGLISIVATMGISSYLIREVELTDAGKASAFTVNAIINATLAAIIFVLSFLGGWAFQDREVGPILRLLALPPLIGIFEFLPATMVQRDMQFKARSVIMTSSILLNTVLTVGLAALGFSSYSMPYATVVVALYRAAAFSLSTPAHVSVRLSLQGWRPILVFGIRMITVSGVAQLTQRISEILMGSLLGLTALGVYSRASSLSYTLFINMYGTATSVIFAQLSKTYRETGVLRETFLRGLQMILAIMWPVLIGLAVLAKPAVHILYGARWDAAAVPLSLLMLAMFIALSFGMNWELFVLRNETGKQAKYEIIRSVSGLAFFGLGAMISLTAASVGRVLESAVGAALYLPKMAKLADARWSELMHIYVESVALTIAAVAPSFVVMIVSGWSAHTAPAMLAGGIALGGVLWLGVLVYFKHPLLDELMTIARLNRRGVAAPVEGV
jgi:O-antigen/teichoic acid export membrane protein